MNPLCYYVTHTYDNIWTKFLNLPKTIYSCYLCIRFPFLYPRNRFTDRHHNIYWFEERISLLKTIETNTVNIKYVNESEYDNTKCNYMSFYVNGKNFGIARTWSKNKESYFYIRDSRKNVFDFKDERILSKGSIKNVFYCNSDKCIYVICSDDFKLNDDIPHIMIELSKNKFISHLISAMNFLYFICGLFYSIPEYTELDQMPTGWRKKFGIKMCKEIKRELKKYGYLRKYRIMQIKEKYGTLRWYDNGSPDGCVYPIIDKYENISYHTCIECGKPANYLSTGWISPYCKNCIGDRTYTLINCEKVKYAVKVINSCTTKTQLEKSFNWATRVVGHNEEIYDAYIETGDKINFH